MSQTVLFDGPHEESFEIHRVVGVFDQVHHFKGEGIVVVFRKLFDSKLFKAFNQLIDFQSAEDSITVKVKNFITN